MRRTTSLGAVSSGPGNDESPRPRGRSRWLSGDRIGVSLLWLVIIASLFCIALVAHAVLASANCQCEGTGDNPADAAAFRAR
jgi:hypothetical protein